MRKKLTAIGNSLGIVIEKPILELLDIDRDTELDMKTDGEKLIIVPIRKGRKQRIKEAMDAGRARHGESLGRLGR